jgi:hypothetical protein
VLPVSSFGGQPGVCHILHMRPSVIVWDLETLPDLAGFAAANDLVGKSDTRMGEADDEINRREVGGVSASAKIDVQFSALTDI